MASHQHHRKQLRLEGYEYNSNGVYCITSLLQRGRLDLGRIKQGKVVLNVFGHIVQSCWIDLPRFFDFDNLDSYVVMPTHFHGLVGFMDNTFRKSEYRQHALL